MSIMFYKIAPRQSYRVCLIQHQNSCYFSVSGLKDEKLIKSNLHEKLKHANSILESFECFCQMSSKSILIIASYTVSNLVHFCAFFLRHSVQYEKLDFNVNA